MDDKHTCLVWLGLGERLADARTFHRPEMPFHREVPGLHGQRAPSKSVRRQRAHDQRFGKFSRRREDGSEVLREALVFSVRTGRDQWPLPPLHIVVARNHVHGCGALEFPNERARGLELTVARPMGEITCENDQARIQVGNEIFHSVHLAKVGVDAKVWIGQVDDAETHDAPVIAKVG